MSNYDKSTNFAVKDTLTSGDPDKVVSGAEIDNEFNSIASAVTSKADKVAAATTDNLAALDANGNLKDSSFPGNATVPSGGIIMWSGLISAIPTGWALCDGTNTTPDLRDRFIVGAGSTYSRNDTGGANSVTLTENQIPSHNHTMDNAGSHSHSMDGAGGHSHSMQTAGNHNHGGNTGSGTPHSHDIRLGFRQDTGHFHETNNHGSASPNPDSTEITSNPIQSESDHTHSISSDGNHKHTINSVNNHTHNINNSGSHSHSINNTGGDGSHENRPPYFALAFIMKL